MKASTRIRPAKSRKFPVWLLFIVGAGMVLLAIVVIGGNRTVTPAAPAYQRPRSERQDRADPLELAMTLKRT